jgi:predicted nuclease of restriction endonuclease-like RecB superfamily
MIPLQLLRVKISNGGKSIAPIFCTSDEDLTLADNIIRGFEESWKKRERKGLLMDRIGRLESQRGDYKLVRGLFTLLERRCTFVRSSDQSKKNGVDSAGIMVEPDVIRRRLFEESSNRDYALTALKREEIIQSVAAELGVNKENVANEMWNDLDENLVLEDFDRIVPATLVAWYNLAVMQTLLFSCTTLQVAIHGGLSWKRVLRDVKRVGLMYNIRHLPSKLADRTTSPPSYDDGTIVCSLDGPLSIFKMTDLYGTAIAKVLPSVISADSWSLQAWVIRNYVSVGRKIYEFQISKKNAPPLIGLPDHNNSEIITAKSNSYFDSSVEEKFAIKFQQSRTNWTLTREPDPIIMNNDKAFIPDFMFERYGRRIYLEIVGFWTIEYIKRKIYKLTRISSKNKQLRDEDKVDLFIAVDNNYYITSKYKNIEKDLISKLSSSVEDDHLILYRNGQVPLRPILSYLKSIDQEMIQEFAITARNDLLADIDRLTMCDNQDNDKDGTRCDGGVVSINDLAEKYNIPCDSVLLALQSREAEYVNDNMRSYINVGTYLIPRSKILELQESLNSISSLTDAVRLFKEHKVPESCHVDLISKLGYEIIWRGIDSTNAYLERRQK